MKTNPWFATEVEEDQDPVYHDNTVCTEGESIKKNYRRYGTDNRPLCKQCAKMDEEGR